MRVDAIVTAGGRGTRISEIGKEKPLIEIGGEPIIKRVLDALEGSERVRNIHVSISGNTPLTERFVKEMGYGTILTSGEDYVADLRDSMEASSSRAVLVCPADVPLITSYSVDRLVDSYEIGSNLSLAVAIPADCFISMGMNPTFEIEVNGERVVLCGVSVVDREMMISGEYLDEGYHVTRRMDFAINVNSVKELRLAETILERRSQSSSPSMRA
jgi:adenosylcobinamide-phosphate guanylyltransferase